MKTLETIQRIFLSLLRLLYGIKPRIEYSLEMTWGLAPLVLHLGSTTMSFSRTDFNVQPIFATTVILLNGIIVVLLTSIIYRFRFYSLAPVARFSVKWFFILTGLFMLGRIAYLRMSVAQLPSHFAGEMSDINYIFTGTDMRGTICFLCLHAVCLLLTYLNARELWFRVTAASHPQTDRNEGK